MAELSSSLLWAFLSAQWCLVSIFDGAHDQTVLLCYWNLNFKSGGLLFHKESMMLNKVEYDRLAQCLKVSRRKEERTKNQNLNNHSVDFMAYFSSCHLKCTKFLSDPYELY